MQKDPYLIITRNIVGEDISMRLAPLFLRMQSFFIDFFIIIQIQIFISFLYIQLILRYSSENLIGSNLLNAKWVFLMILVFLVQVGYYIIQEYFLNGQTIGKRILKLRIISVSGGGASFHAILIRNLVGIIEVGYFPIIAGFVSLFNSRGQRIGDILTSCYVVFEEPFA